MQNYTDVPQGGNVSIPPAIPSQMLYRVKQIQNLSKQVIKIVPVSGQTTAANGSKIIVTLPPNSLVDLSTFEFNFTGNTYNHSNAGGFTSFSTGTTNNAAFVQKAYFPRLIQSIISGIEIKVNGQSRQNISQYGYLFRLLNDFTCGADSLAKARVGENGDPSEKSIRYQGQVKRIAGYPLSLIHI